ncbi:MAG: shikimate dehydrogenase [Legionellales bacterium RIFCSPHIGHO2_12_FULL_37_14]|nr:MAG: shikimate dehydrogenase [Legionellales bacterium RIFCSPHIGHO2_12_FULL_37_14]
MQITNNTVLNLVIGNPLTHTKSPYIHQYIYKYLGIDAILLARSSNSLASLIAAIRALDVKLTAVTIPFKEEVIHYLDDYSQEVEAIGSCNTIIQNAESLYGYNTDFYGLTYAFRQTPIYQKTALIIGAGGAARSAAYFLNEHKAKIYWLNRTIDKANKLALLFGGEVVSACLLNKLNIDVIINTTPIGLYPHHHATPLPNYHFNPDQIVFDMVYNPKATKLLRTAKKQQAICISGVDMFIGQAIKQVMLWQNRALPVDEIYHLLRTKCKL